MRTDNPPDRVIRIIADMIGRGRLLICPASMFSAERFNGAFHGIAITTSLRNNIFEITSRVYSTKGLSPSCLTHTGGNQEIKVLVEL